MSVFVASGLVRLAVVFVAVPVVAPPPADAGPSEQPIDVTDARASDARAVVEAQLKLFSNWWSDPQAAEHAFALASPENRETIGSVDRFRAVVESPGFRPLIDNRGWLCGEAVVVESARIALVTTIDDAGKLALFRYYLKSDQGQPEPSWTIDAVVPVSLTDGTGSAARR